MPAIQTTPPATTKITNRIGSDICSNTPSSYCRHDRKGNCGDPSTMKIPYYEVHAFTSLLFAGNPAGICLLEEWLPDNLLQQIAAENNLAETAFLIDRGEFFDIRWLAPSAEIDLCGHATL